MADLNDFDDDFSEFSCSSLTCSDSEFDMDLISDIAFATRAARRIRQANAPAKETLPSNKSFNEKHIETFGHNSITSPCPKTPRKTRSEDMTGSETSLASLLFKSYEASKASSPTKIS